MREERRKGVKGSEKNGSRGIRNTKG